MVQMIQKPYIRLTRILLEGYSITINNLDSIPNNLTYTITNIYT